MKKPKSHMLNIEHCARCDGDHKNLVFRPLDNAPDEWQWWATCPQTGQPILMKVVEEKA